MYCLILASMAKPQTCCSNFPFLKGVLWQIWTLRKFFSHFWAVAAMKGWEHMGRSLLFSFLPQLCMCKLPNTSCICTQLWDAFQRRCLFSLTLPLPWFSLVLIFFYGFKCEQSPSIWNLPAASEALWRPKSESHSLPCLVRGALWGENSRHEEWGEAGREQRAGKIQAKGASGPSVAEGGCQLGRLAGMESPSSAAPIYFPTTPFCGIQDLLPSDFFFPSDLDLVKRKKP